MNDKRPDPDALLALLPAESAGAGRGRLKIFFGASAGVGKTYAMLQEARERKAAGVGVLIGYVEAHKRPETLALLEGLEALDPLMVDYRGVRAREFDLDAALRRRPELVLVDELAHTNADGLRHAKRWQDVVELLDAGIDVYTTVNVQHVESLNDIVAQITGVVVHETIPDSILERADEIELIDLPPDDLLQRLREGKVYVSEQVQRALDHFFRREALVALRELALRQTADRVNAEVQAERAGLAIDRPWRTADRLLVCVGPSPLSARVVRVARRMAAAQRCEWYAVAVETPGFSVRARDLVRSNLHLAERLGAQSVTLNGERVADEVLAYARRQNVTRIVIGKPSLPRWREWLRGSIVDELIRQSGEIDVHIVKGAPEEQSVPHPAESAPPRDWKPYAWSLLVLTACTAAAWGTHRYLSAVNLTMIYLAGVVFVATRFGAGPSIMAALVTPLAFNFFFTKPYYSFAIDDAQYVVTVVVLLVTAIVVSGLAQRVRRQAAAVRSRYLRTMGLYFMSRMLAGAVDKQAVQRATTRHISDVFGGETVILATGANGHLDLSGTHAAWFDDNASERAAAEWVFRHEQWAGQGTDTLPGCAAMYLPLIASARALGVLGLKRSASALALEPEQRHMLETFAAQLAIALERAEFAEQAERARVEAESEQIRNALLSSVSHDLRTPLASISGCASTLLADDAQLTAETRRELLTSIHQESARLNQFVGKLLDMTRLESAGIQPARDWYPLEEIVGSALTRLEANLHEHDVRIDLPNHLPLLFVDGVLLEEVLINLLENAARYTPPGSMIRISARTTSDDLSVDVIDNGPGLPQGMEANIFGKFVRDRPRGDRSGVGLGLAICRAIVRLHGGRIEAANRPEGGAVFRFIIPLERRIPPAAALPSDMTQASRDVIESASQPRGAHG